MIEVKTTATPSVNPPSLLKHITKRQRQSDGSWGPWDDTVLCGKLWDRVELPGRPNCEECLKVLKRELGL